MSGERPRRPPAATLLPFLVLAGLVAGVIANPGLRALLGAALTRIGPLAVLATLPGQLAASLLCAAALHVLRPGVSYAGSLGSRLMRDAGGNLLIFMPGLGEMVGARALVLAGGKTRAALGAMALDMMTEVVAQIPFYLLAFSVVPRFWQMVHLPRLGAPGEVMGGGVMGGIALALIACLAGGAIGWRRWARDSRMGRRLRAELHLLWRQIRRQRRGVPASIGLHFLAWIAGGVQLWMAAGALGLAMPFMEAMAIDSVAYAARGMMFFVPAGLVLQEASLVGAGLAFGLPAQEGLALALVLRLRDLVFGTALLAWPAMEWRARRSISSAS